MLTHVLAFAAIALVSRGAEAQLPPVPESPPGPHWPLNSAAHRDAPSYTRGQRVVGTTYFYWYDYESGEHVIDPDGSDALTTHPVDMEGLSYRSADWHEAQLRDVAAAGIDFILPVYWGVPGQYESGWFHWSFAGLPHLVEAHDRLVADALEAPGIGLFLDTSIFRHNAIASGQDGTRIDLRTDHGKRFFHACVRDFFSFIPPDKWARVDGRPIVFLYSATYAAGQDPEAFPYVRRAFEEEFGTGLYIVKMRDWLGDADSVYQWTGASGFQVDRDVVAIAPGYDHSAVHGREPLVVDREDGALYTERWFRALRFHRDRGPWMVHVESWNEWHEGTDIAHSREYGRKYIALTRVFSELWRSASVEFTGPYSDARAVTWEADSARGLVLDPGAAPASDGVWRRSRFDGVTAVVTAESGVAGTGRYLYFDVDDSFAFDAPGVTFALEVVYLDAGCESFRVDYDNADPEEGLVEGAFRPTREVPIQGTGEWRTARFTLDDSRFAGRANGSDFRLAATGGRQRLAVRKVTLRRGAAGR